MDELSATHLRAFRAEAIAPATFCPNCNSRLVFHRSQIPDFDACGFESYKLQCSACGATLAGVIDPADETLLLSAVPA
jgi:uncharacterized protein with PIN domain